jgi:hypothetical protein
LATAPKTKGVIMEIINNKSENNVIYETIDYGMFKFSGLQRSIGKSHVNKIIKSIMMFDTKEPITVDQHFIVLDGHHRIQARKELKSPVYYRVVTLTEEQKQLYISATNLTRNRWTNTDVLNAISNKALTENKILLLEYVSQLMILPSSLIILFLYDNKTNINSQELLNDLFYENYRFFNTLQTLKMYVKWTQLIPMIRSNTFWNIVIKYPALMESKDMIDRLGDKTNKTLRKALTGNSNEMNMLHFLEIQGWLKR